jgi:hypothetical protein
MNKRGLLKYFPFANFMPKTLIFYSQFIFKAIAIIDDKMNQFSHFCCTSLITSRRDRVSTEFGSAPSMGKAPRPRTKSLSVFIIIMIRPQHNGQCAEAESECVVFRRHGRLYLHGIGADDLSPTIRLTSSTANL